MDSPTKQMIEEREDYVHVIIVGHHRAARQHALEFGEGAFSPTDMQIRLKSGAMARYIVMTGAPVHPRGLRINSFAVHNSVRASFALDALRSNLRARMHPVYRCFKCGAETSIADDNMEATVCEECCEDHNYAYEGAGSGHRCTNCDASPPDDWYQESGL